MKSNKAKPQYRWEEYYAKVVLESKFPERFFQLEIADKPDLQNQTANIGIEVTSAVQKEVRETESLFSRLTNTQEPNQIREKRKNRIQRLGGEFHDKGYMSCGVSYKDLSDVYSSFEDKLNSGSYHLFQKQFAFIFDYNLIREGKLGEIHTELSKRQKRFQTRFSSVF